MNFIKNNSGKNIPLRSKDAKNKNCNSCTDFKPCVYKGINYKTSRNKRLQVILDLDSTLINSLDFSKELKYFPESEQKYFKHVDMKNHYRIFQRPYLQIFLDYAFANFDVSIFTAADKMYMTFIIDNIILIKPERKLQFVFWGLHSFLSENLYSSPKDLRLLWDYFQIPQFTPCSTLIVDDLDLVYQNNPNNSIEAPKFDLLINDKQPNYAAKNDNFLLSLIPKLEARRIKFINNICSCCQGSKFCNAQKHDNSHYLQTLSNYKNKL
jgi:hypothetical protein